MKCYKDECMYNEGFKCTASEVVVNAEGHCATEVDLHQLMVKVGHDMEATLTDIYADYKVKSGDISPEQTRRWDQLVKVTAAMMYELMMSNGGPHND